MFLFGSKKAKKQEELVMPDFINKYRKYRLEGCFGNEWIVLSKLIDNVDDAKSLKLKIIKNCEEDWTIKNDKEGWLVVE